MKRHFPDSIGLMTAVYTTALAIGLTAAFTLTVPFSEALATSSWRTGAGRLGGAGRRWRPCRGSCCGGSTTPAR